MLRLLACLYVVTIALPGFCQAVKVEITTNERGHYTLKRGGLNYYIKGAGGSTELDRLVAIGGNSFRTWSTDNAREVLDAAHERGLTVMMGLWVQHERHGFDYDDSAKVAAQLEGFRKVVLELKDHPALLLWGVGNEVDLFYTNTKVWYAVNDIAKMIHELDPNHPTCTVTAGLDAEEVRLIKERAPHIDIYGINTYGDIGQVPANIRKFGWSGPYIISEWGPNGHWEVQKTKWGSPVEQTGSEKANSYEQRYTQYISAHADQCLGSYVFLWGQKQETTSTWYGLFSEKGESSEAIDRLQRLWTGTEPANRCPALDSLTLGGLQKGANITFKAGEKIDARAFARDADGDELRYVWWVVPESTDIKAGGDAESKPQPVNGAVVRRKENVATVRVPSVVGAYRLFAFVYDGQGHYNYGNIPFFVFPAAPGDEPTRAVSFKKLEMP